MKDVECGYLDYIEIFGNSENVISSKHKLVTLTAGYTFDESGNQIEGPNIIELSEDLDMKLFDKRPRLEIESGTLNPKVNIYHPGTLQNTIQELLSDIRCLSVTELTSAKLTLNSIYVR